MKLIEKIFSNGGIRKIHQTEENKASGSNASNILDGLIRLKKARSASACKNGNPYFLSSAPLLKVSQ